MTIPAEVYELVERFDRNRDEYLRNYNETQVRGDFIDPLLEALGWDVHNRQGYPEAYRQVIEEDKIKVGGGKHLQQQAEGIIETIDELRVLLAPLDIERSAVESEIEALGDQEDRLRELDMLPALVDEYLRDLAYLVDGSGVFPASTRPSPKNARKPIL